MEIISVKSLNKSFRVKTKEEGFKGSLKAMLSPKYKEVKAVNNLSFEVRKGEVLAFIGPNGAGKSTTIKMLTGILYPTSGEIEVLGLNPSQSRKKLSFKIGTVFGQKSQLWFHLPPLDSFNLLGRIYEMEISQLKKRISELTELFEIGALLEIPVRKLSLAISSTSYGLTFVLFGNIRRISQMIINGELDTYLLQPKDVLINIIASSTITSAWGDIFYGIILFIGLYGLNPLAFLLFLLFCITGAIIFSSVLIFANALTFYMGDSQGIYSLAVEFLITFSIYPEGIYKGFTKLLIYTLLPAAFISLIPVRLIIQFSWKWLLLLILVVLGWAVFSYLFFKRGLKRYESGNLIVNKL